MGARYGAGSQPPGGGHGGSGPIGLGTVWHAHARTPAKITANTNATSFLMTALLTGTAALAAFVALLTLGEMRGRWGLLYLTGCASSFFLLALYRPADWTPEAFVTSESLLAVAATVAGIEAARRARTRPDMLFAAFCLAGTAGAIGWYSMRLVPLLPDGHWAYRGTAFLDLAVTALLATIAQRSAIVDRLDRAALPWLAACFGLSCLRLLLFEIHFGLGRFFGWLQVFAWTVGMLLIARAAIARWQPRPSPSR